MPKIESKSAKSKIAKSTSKKSPTKVSSPKVEALKTSPRDVFLHLLMLVMLYLAVISIIFLATAYIDYALPDSLGTYATWALADIRWWSAMLVISFPLLLILSHFVQKDFRTTPEKHQLRFYKWLTYLTLFVSAITIVIDLIQLVHRFYSGELQPAFVLKVLSVLIVAGAVFGYYMWEVQSESYKSKLPKMVGWLTSVVVIGMLVLGFLLAGSPNHQRKVRMDEQRLNDLSSIQSQITSYWQTKRELPQDLKALRNDLSYFYLPQDPQTGEDYEYRAVSDLSFELCATFELALESSDESSTVRYDYGGYNPYPYTGQVHIWDHGVGRTCFERTIDPELYPDTTQSQTSEPEAIN